MTHTLISEHTLISNNDFHLGLKTAGRIEEPTVTTIKAMMEADYKIVYRGLPWDRKWYHLIDIFIVPFKILWYTLFNRHFRKEYWRLYCSKFMTR